MVSDTGSLLTLLLVMISVMTGGAASAVAFLLFRQKNDPILRDFGGLVAGMGLYGLADYFLSLLWSKVVLDPRVMALGLAMALGMVLVAGFSLSFLIRLGGIRLHRLSSWLIWGPLHGALVVATVLLLNQGGHSDKNGFMNSGRVFLFLMFLWIAVGLVFVLLKRRKIHDRLLRRIVLVTAGVLLLFFPVWLLESSGVFCVHGFYWFCVVWNSGFLILAARAWFAREQKDRRPGFDRAALDAVGTRFGLTERELEILEHHLKGIKSADIGAALFLSPKTVRNHISHIYEKTGTHGRFPLLTLVESKMDKPASLG